MEQPKLKMQKDWNHRAWRKFKKKKSAAKLTFLTLIARPKQFTLISIRIINMLLKFTDATDN